MNTTFESAIESILQRDKRYAPEAYEFLRAALDYTIKTQRRGVPRRSPRRHVTATELLEGIRRYALLQFGPMALTVLNHWGVRNCRDFGNMVYNLIDAKIFGASENDRIEDFDIGYDFHEAFVKPYCPQKPLHLHKRNQPDTVSQKQRSRVKSHETQPPPAAK